MINLSGKTYWLIGASEGLGRELAKQLADERVRVIVSARNLDRLTELCTYSDHLSPLALDVTDEQAVAKAAQQIATLDGIIYCAGAYDPMSALAWDSKAVQRMCDVNFTGALNVLSYVLPRFVENQAGDITFIGSLSAYRGLPNAIGYGASKAALRSLAETLRFDLAGSGVVVRLVNPGFIKTRLTQKNSFKMPQLMTPEKAATRVVKAMKSRRFRTDFPAPFSWALKMMAFLPDWLIYRGK